MDKVDIILTRHGETLENRQNMMQGHIPGTLSPRGIEQAEQLADLLEGEHLDHVVCSDLARSFDTAQAVTRRRGLVPEPIALLREIDWGKLTGGKLSDIDWTNLPDGVETLDCLYERAGLFVEYLRENYAGKHILVVGHGAVNRAIVANLEKKKSTDMPIMPIMKNTSCVRFTI